MSVFTSLYQQYIVTFLDQSHLFSIRQRPISAFQDQLSSLRSNLPHC